MHEAHAKSITVVFTAVMGFSTSVKTRRGYIKQTNQTPSASGEILEQFVAASIGRHDGERKWVTAENLTLVKTVTEIATDLEANLKGLDVPTEKERGTHTDQEESEEAIKHAQKHAKELQMERTDKNYIFEKLRLRGAWIYKQRCFSLKKLFK